MRNELNEPREDLIGTRVQSSHPFHEIDDLIHLRFAGESIWKIFV